MARSVSFLVPDYVKDSLDRMVTLMVAQYDVDAGAVLSVALERGITAMASESHLMHRSGMFRQHTREIKDGYTDIKRTFRQGVSHG